ncbi:MAG: hypothetical protein WBP91_19105 [Terriglobales bacterium]
MIAQAVFISANRFDLHRKFGLFGFGLACGMIVVGLMAATDSMTRIQMVGPFDTRTFYAVPMFDVIVFAVLTFFAYRWRHDPATHKRLILITSITIVDAATVRDPLTKITQLPYLNNVFTQLYTVLLAGFDLWYLKRIHRATFDSGGVFNCDAAGCDSPRQYGAMDDFCELDVGDSKGDQKTGCWTIIYASADAMRKPADMGTREMSALGLDLGGACSWQIRCVGDRRSRTICEPGIQFGKFGR